MGAKPAPAREPPKPSARDASRYDWKTHQSKDGLTKAQRKARDLALPGSAQESPEKPAATNKPRENHKGRSGGQNNSQNNSKDSGQRGGERPMRKRKPQ